MPLYMKGQKLQLMETILDNKLRKGLLFVNRLVKIKTLMFLIFKIYRNG